MNTTKGMNPAQQNEASFAGPETVGVADAHEPRKLTLAQNVILTIKVLMGFALLGGVLWAAKLWTSVK